MIYVGYFHMIVSFVPRYVRKTQHEHFSVININVCRPTFKSILLLLYIFLDCTNIFSRNTDRSHYTGQDSIRSKQEA